MDQVKIGKFIQEKRKEKNITQKDLADMLNITDKTISRWENGHYLPDLSLWEELCKILEISILDFINGEKVTDNNISIEGIEENFCNTVKITNKKISSMRKKNFMLIFIIIFVVAIIMFALIFQINKNNKFVPLQFISRYAYIEKEDGWICSFHINNYEFSDYYHYDCENLKYDTLYDYQSSIIGDNGVLYKANTPWISYVWSEYYSNDITNISNYFNENKFNDFITLNDLDELSLTSDISKQEIVDLYNNTIVATKINKFGNFRDYSPVQVVKSKIVDNYQWIFGYKIEHGFLVNVYLDIKYNDKWLSSLKDKSSEQVELLESVPEIEKFILNNQILKLPEKYKVNRNYFSLINVLEQIKAIDY